MGEAGAEFAPRIAEMLRDSDVQESAFNALEQFPQKVSSQVIFGCVEAAHADPKQYPEFLLKAYLACGVSDENLVLIRWLGNRDQNERPAIDSNNHAARLTVLNVMREALPQTAQFPKAQKEMSEIIASLARAGNWNLSDIATLTFLKNDLKDYPDQAGAVQTAIDGIQSYHRLKTYGGIALGHAIFWFTLVVAYPRSRMVQGFFFWNKWPRRMFGLWYVGFARSFKIHVSQIFQRQRSGRGSPQFDAEIQALAVSVDLKTSIPEGSHAAGLSSFFNTQFKWHNSSVFQFCNCLKLAETA